MNQAAAEPPGVPLSWREMDIASFLDIFRPVIRRLQAYSGVSSQSLARVIGEEIGRGMAAKMTSRNLNDLLAEMSGIWKRLELGYVEIENRDPLILAVSGCTGCEQTPDAGLSLGCPLREGIVKSILRERLGQRCDTTLVQSTGSGPGFNDCRFTVTFARP